MCISTTTLTSSPSGLTAAGQKQEACSSTGSLTRPSPSDRPRTTPSSLTLSLATRPPNWSEADTLSGQFENELDHDHGVAAMVQRAAAHAADPQAFLSTDLNAVPATILGWSVSRW